MGMNDGSSGDGAGGNPLAGGLGRRLLGWFLVFSLLPLFLTNAAGYLRSEDLIERLVERYLAAITQVEALHVRGEIDRYRLDLRAIAAGNEFLRAGTVVLSGGDAGEMGGVASPRAVRDYLARKRAELGTFEVLYLQATDGRVLATSGVPVSELAEFGAPGVSNGTVTGLDVAVEEAPPRFRLAVPLGGDDGGPVVGYLAGVLSPEGLAGLLEIPEHLAGSIESFIVDADGSTLFISHPHGRTEYGERLATPLIEGPAGGFATYSDRHGQQVLGTSVMLQDLPWRFIAEVPVSDALGPLQALRRLSFVVGIVLAIALSIVAWFVAAGMVAPVRRLVAATRQVGAGDLSVRVDTRRSDEIGELGGAFNDMTSDLAEASSRVRELHRREIERAQQLATVGELASGVAHEIKNPAVGIANGLDLVSRRVGDDPKLAPILDELKRQVSRISDAVRDLLAFARPATPTYAATDANRIIERAVVLIRPAAEHADVIVLHELDPILPGIEADEELIRQAIVNLLLNAVQATPAGGRVVVSTRPAEDGITIRVADTGRGMAAGDIEHIFKPFFTTKHSGTGLGLSITREIVERHGGSIRVESRVGGGSVFTVRLPVNAAPAVTAAGGAT